MRDEFEGYVVRWLALLEEQPSGVLARVVSDLAARPEADRPALARRFAALLYGPRVEPDRIRLLMGQLARASGQAAPAAIVAGSKLEKLERMEAALSARLAELEPAGESESAARCRALETAVATVRESARCFRTLLLRAGCEPEEVTK